jgi:plasmid maintenance system killer protein
MRYIKVLKPSDIKKEGLYYIRIDGKTELCFYWSDCDSLEIIHPA